jgi:hypothetical protein
VDDARITGPCIPQKDGIVREDRFGSLIFVHNDSDNLGSLVAGIIHHHGPGDERQELRDRASAMRSTWPRGARASVLVNGATRPRWDSPCSGYPGWSVVGAASGLAHRSTRADDHVPHRAVPIA